MTTLETLTLAQVQALAAEAGTHGDHATAADCALLEDAYLESPCGDIPTMIDWERGAVRDAAERIVAVINDAQAQDAPEAYGYTFSEWLAAAGRSDSASEHDLRAAWRAGEDPSEYQP